MSKTEQVQEQKAQQKAQGIEAVRRLVEAEQAKAQVKADTLLEKGKAHTYAMEEAQGAHMDRVAEVRKVVTDNEKGTVRLYFTAKLVTRHFCRAVGLTADEFKGLWAEYKDTAAYPFFSAVVLDYTPKAALLAAIKE